MHTWFQARHNLHVAAHLNEPEDVVRVELVLAVPGGKDVPLHVLAAVDGDAVLSVLVLAGLQVHQHLLGQLRQVPPVQDVVLLPRHAMNTHQYGVWFAKTCTPAWVPPTQDVRGLLPPT